MIYQPAITQNKFESNPGEVADFYSTPAQIHSRNNYHYSYYATRQNHEGVRLGKV